MKSAYRHRRVVRQNIVKVRAPLRPQCDLVLQPLASSYATEDEKELGVCLVDIGGA